MNKTFTRICGTAVLCMLLHTFTTAQDISITAESQRNNVSNSVWPFGAPDCSIRLTICNNDGGSAAVPEYKLMPVLTVAAGLVEIASNDDQPGLPAGWTILSNDGVSIRLSNGTDTWLPGECREVSIKVLPIAIGGPDQFTAALEFADGNPPGDVPGAPTVDNNPDNDNSVADATIVSTLPARLIFFNAVNEGGAGRLTWTAATTDNGTRFEVEYSPDGYTWHTVTRLPANAGTESYTFTHPTLAAGKNYYRLRIAGHGGAVTFSPIRMIDAGTGAGTVLYPNPAKDRLQITLNDNSMARLIIYSSTGRPVKQQALQKGTNAVSVADLAAGLYLVTIAKADGRETHRLTVQ